MAKTIAVAGKGGTGKSTISSLIVLGLAARNQGPILAIDADADANMNRLLGVGSSRTIGDLREEVRNELNDFPPGMSKAQYMQAGLHEVIEEAEGFDLLTMGRGEGAGCYCYLNNLIRKFSQDLAPCYPWIVMDNEAGLEHISRSLIGDIDALLIVVNNSPLAMDSARNIKRLAEDLNTRVRHMYIVTNMLRDIHKAAIFKQIEELGLEHLADVPSDPAMEDIVIEGNSLQALQDSPILTAINTIIDTLGG